MSQQELEQHNEERREDAERLEQAFPSETGAIQNQGGVGGGSQPDDGQLSAGSLGLSSLPAAKASAVQRVPDLTEDQIENWRKYLLNEPYKQKFGNDFQACAEALCDLALDGLKHRSAIRPTEPTFVLGDWTAGDLKELADRLMECAGTAFIAGERDKEASDTRTFIKTAIVEASQLIEYWLIPALAAAPAAPQQEPVPDAGPLLPSGIGEWFDHLELHLTEHDERHAGLALRAAWPPVRDYFLRKLAKTSAHRPEETRIEHDWQPDGGVLRFETHPGGEAPHIHTTCAKCGARAWFLEYQWELLTKGCGATP